MAYGKCSGFIGSLCKRGIYGEPDNSRREQTLRVAGSVQRPSSDPTRCFVQVCYRRDLLHFVCFTVQQTDALLLNKWEHVFHFASQTYIIIRLQKHCFHQYNWNIGIFILAMHQTYWKLKHSSTKQCLYWFQTLPLFKVFPGKLYGDFLAESHVTHQYVNIL